MPKPRPQPRTLVPQKHGGALKPGGDGVSGGRPPDAFKAMCRTLASSADVARNVEKILASPERYPTLYIGALKWASEHGYGKPTEHVEVTGKDGGPVQVWKIGKKEIRF